MPNKCGNHALFRRFGCVRIDIHLIGTAIEKSPKHPSYRHGIRKMSKTSILLPQQHTQKSKTSILSSRQLKKTQNINPVVTTTRYLFCRHNYTPFSGNNMIVKTNKNRVSAFRPEQADSLKPFDFKATEKGTFFKTKSVPFSIHQRKDAN